MKNVLTGLAIAGGLLGGWWLLSPSNYSRTDDPKTTRDFSTGDYDCSDFSSQSEDQDLDRKSVV